MGLAIQPPLLLPKRHRLFDSIDRFAARGERVISMWSARRDADRDVANPERADAMNGGDSYACILGSNALEHSLHLFVCEAVVGFVVEPGDLLSVGMVANDPMKDANATCSRMLDRFADFIG